MKIYEKDMVFDFGKYAVELPTLTQNEVSDIIVFMHALTDTSYVNKLE